MAMTIVGLFDERTDATTALNDLINNGFNRGDIDEIMGNASGLVDDLKRFGVPEQDGQLFAQGVREGDTLLVAHTSDDRADLARDIMNRFGALEINDVIRTRGVNPAYTTASTVPTVATGAALGATALHTPPTTVHAATAPATNLTAAPATTSTNMTRTLQAGETVAVPIVEEQLVVGKREIERGGAVIHKRVIETPVQEQVTLREEHVTVERHPVDRPATAQDTANALRENTINVTERSEEAVVGKTARVVEEIVIGKEATQHTETIRDTVRRTDVDVNEVDAEDLTVSNRTSSTPVNR